MTFAATVLTLYPEMFPGPLGMSLAGRALARGDVVARRRANPRFRDRQAPHGRRHAGRRRGGDGAARRRARRGGRSMPSRDGRPDARHDPARQAAHPGARPRAGGGPGRDHPVRPVRGVRRADLRGARRSSRCRSATMSCRAASSAALVLLDACIRLLPGVMGAASSGDEESFETGLLEYPHYTRPVEWEGRTIPEVLRSGDHAKIAAWRQDQAPRRHTVTRPDLWERHGGARDQPASGAQRRRLRTKDNEPHPDARGRSDRRP